MVKPFDKMVCYSSQEVEAATPHRPHGEGSPRSGQEAEEVRGDCGQRLNCGFDRKEWERQVKQLGLSSLNNFSGLWATGVIPVLG